MRLFRASLVILALVGFSGSANAAVITWSASLDASQENPSNASTGTGIGTVTFDDVTNVLTLDLTWAGLTGPGVQAHIHCCVAPTGNAGIAVDLWLVATPQPATGSFTRVEDLDLVNPFRAAFVAANGGTPAMAFATLVAAMNSGHAYFNIHTANFPGGEIRGNISPAAPEPATVLLLTLGAGAVALRRRRVAAR
jgi:hypothetical protein